KLGPFFEDGCRPTVRLLMTRTWMHPASSRSPVAWVSGSWPRHKRSKAGASKLTTAGRPPSRTPPRPRQPSQRVLDNGSYAFSMPGMPEAIRVTTRAEIFDDHFESHEFL